MTTKLLGETIAYDFECRDSSGALFDPDVAQVSLVKDHNVDDPTASLYEDTLTYLGSEPRDSQLVRLSVGKFRFSYAVDRLGIWAILPRWTDPDLPAGGMVSSGTPIIIHVVPTEHTFTDREALIPPGGGDPVSGPYATATTGGMLTDVMAARFAGLPLNYFVANWAIEHWYINAATGDDSNDGSEAHPLATSEELTARLAVSVPIDHPVTVHVAQGSYGTLAVRVSQSTLACPFSFAGEVAYTDIGTIASYTDRVAATNTAAHLVASGVTDWAPHVGKLVLVTSGAQTGAVCAVAKSNPHSAGIDVARVSQFAQWSSSTALQSSSVSPAAGSGLALLTLPHIETLAVSAAAPCSNVGTPIADWAAIRLGNLSLGMVDASATSGVAVDRCTFRAWAEAQFAGIRFNTAQPWICRSVGDLRASQYLRLSRIAARHVLFLGTGPSTLNVSDQSALTNVLCQGVRTQIEQSSMSDSGAFDASGASGHGVSGSKVYVGYCQLFNIYGRDNAQYGARVQSVGRVSSPVANTITGALGDVVAGTSPIPWTALPWQDGERSGEATLVAGTVDVTVPYVLSTQKMVAGYKTFGGATGSLLAKYVDATTIRIVSSSATDTSDITWHILPVGDNAVIRS
jgi:hypothetical protein